MTRAYRQGFLTKCAEFGVSNDVVDEMFKLAAIGENKSSLDKAKNLLRSFFLDHPALYEYETEKNAQDRYVHPLEKIASPFLRKVLQLSPEVLNKIKITPNVYKSFLRGRSPTYVPGALSKANRRHTLRFSDLMSKDLGHLLDDKRKFGIDFAKDKIKQRIGTYTVPSYADSVKSSINELNRNGINTLYDLIQAQGDRTAYGREIIDKILKRRDRIRQLSFEINSGSRTLPTLAERHGLSASEFDKLYPDSISMFKGGPYTDLWPINRPGWMTGRKSVAFGYAANPTRMTTDQNLPFITVARRKDSKALQKGRTFFTGHVASGNRRERIDAMKSGNRFHDVPTKADMFPDYEIVLPGSDMRRMPASTYFVAPSSGERFSNVRQIMDQDVPFGSIPARFHKITDQKRFNQIMEDIFSKSEKVQNNKSAIDMLQHTLERRGSVFQSPGGIDHFIRNLYQKRKYG